MKRERRIKTIATLGPASSTEEMCAKLFEAGVDVFRINMSHTQRETLAEKVAMLRGLEGIVTKDASDADDIAFRACKFAVREHYAKIGDRVIVVAGVPFGTPGATNMVRIAFIGQEHVAKA